MANVALKVSWNQSGYFLKLKDATFVSLNLPWFTCSSFVRVFLLFLVLIAYGFLWEGLGFHLFDLFSSCFPMSSSCAFEVPSWILLDPHELFAIFIYAVSEGSCLLLQLIHDISYIVVFFHV